MKKEEERQISAEEGEFQERVKAWKGGGRGAKLSHVKTFPAKNNC